MCSSAALEHRMRTLNGGKTEVAGSSPVASTLERLKQGKLPPSPAEGDSDFTSRAPLYGFYSQIRSVD